MVYVVIAARTALSNVSFPARLRNRVDQLRDLWRMRSTIEVNKSLFLFPKCSGSPRYLPSPPSLLIPKIVFAVALTSSGVFEEKVTEEFSFIYLLS